MTNKKWSDVKGKREFPKTFDYTTERNNLTTQINVIDYMIEDLPLKNGHVDYNSRKFKNLSNKRAMLYNKRQELDDKYRGN